VPNLVPLWAVVSFMNELFQHSPSDTRGIQPNVLSSGFEVHDLKFAGRITVMGLLCGDGERRMIGRPGSRNAGNAMLGCIWSIASGRRVLVIGGF